MICSGMVMPSGPVTLGPSAASRGRNRSGLQTEVSGAARRAFGPPGAELPPGGEESGKTSYVIMISRGADTDQAAGSMMARMEPLERGSRQSGP